MTTPKCATDVICLLAGVILIACGGATEGNGDAGSCAFSARFRGLNYDALNAEVAPVEGKPLGAAVLPACNDTDSTKASSTEQIQVSQLPGVSPGVALVWQHQGDTVLVREGLKRLPPEVRELLQAPSCDTRDAPIRLTGPWLGILGANGKTEVDLVPPYDIDLLVENASAPRYVRAFLTVRVPADLGEPLTRRDVRSSLAEGGNISVAVACDGTRYLAEQVQSSPPS